MSLSGDVVIVGAGLAGLACSRELTLRGIDNLVVDASDGIGGRVRTDHADGFQFDRGFQVYLTAYPEGQRVFDPAKLDFRRFRPGARIWFGRRWHLVADPWRDTGAALRGILSPIGSLGDKFRIAQLRTECLSGAVEDLSGRPELSTADMLRESGFSSAMIDRFFRPFFGGICLDPQLSVSRRMFEFVFRMMATGDTVVPRGGMGQLPAQLEPRKLILDQAIASIRPEANGWRLRSDTGDSLRARALVVATDGAAAGRLIPGVEPCRFRGVICHYFSAPEPPADSAWLLLNGEGTGPINNVAVMSEIAPEYAPAGRALIAVTVLSGGTELAPVIAQLRTFFGAAADSWTHLRTYAIPHAQPARPGPLTERPARLAPGVFVCGDHWSTPSIHHALRSGRLAAEAVAAEAAGS